MKYAEYEAISNALKGMLKNIGAINIKKGSPVWEPSENGCVKCYNTGYKGRTGIFEIMEITRELEEKIMTNPTEDELRDFAFEKGMTNLKQDGILKILEGVTSIEEIERVLGKI